MTSIHVRRYAAGDEARWDAFVEAAATGTLLHTRRFLSYHGDRFADASLLVFDGPDKLCAVLPAAVDPGDPACVCSHPGATYGGLLVAAASHGLEVFDALQAACAHYADAGFERLAYKAVPVHLHATPGQADAYALWRAGARL